MLFRSMGFFEIILEGPTMHSLDVFNNKLRGNTIADSWMQEIWASVNKFRRCTLCSIPPGINKGDWVLAKFGSTLQDSKTWIKEVLMILQQDVL